MGNLSMDDINDLERSLCNEKTLIIVKRTKKYCEITGHTLAAIIIYTIHTIIEFFNFIVYYILGSFLHVREHYLRIKG